MEILFNVTTRFVIAHAADARIAIPFTIFARCLELCVDKETPAICTRRTQLLEHRLHLLRDSDICVGSQRSKPSGINCTLKNPLPSVDIVCHLRNATPESGQSVDNIADRYAVRVGLEFWNLDVA